MARAALPLIEGDTFLIKTKKPWTHIQWGATINGPSAFILSDHARFAELQSSGKFNRDIPALAKYRKKILRTHISFNAHFGAAFLSSLEFLLWDTRTDDVSSIPPPPPFRADDAPATAARAEKRFGFGTKHSEPKIIGFVVPRLVVSSDGNCLVAVIRPQLAETSRPAKPEQVWVWQRTPAATGRWLLHRASTLHDAAEPLLQEVRSRDEGAGVHVSTIHIGRDAAQGAESTAELWLTIDDVWLPLVRSPPPADDEHAWAPFPSSTPVVRATRCRIRSARFESWRPAAVGASPLGAAPPSLMCWDPSGSAVVFSTTICGDGWIGVGSLNAKSELRVSTLRMADGGATDQFGSEVTDMSWTCDGMMCAAINGRAELRLLLRTGEVLNIVANSGPPRALVPTILSQRRPPSRSDVML